MFINCPACRALVATDPATDLPPECCPRCGVALREPAASIDAADATAAMPPDPPRTDDAAPAAGDAAAATAVHAHDGGTTDDVATEHDASRAMAFAAAAVAVTRAAERPRHAYPAAAPPVLATRQRRSFASFLTRFSGKRADAEARDTAIGADAPAAAIESARAEPSVDVAAASVAERLPADDADAAHLPASDAGTASPSAMPTSGGVIADVADAPASSTTHAATVNAGAASGDRVESSSADASAAIHRLEKPGDETAAAGQPSRSAARAAPSFAHARRAPRTTNGWAIGAAIATLGGTLLLQLLLADRAQLAAQARWRPTLTALCGALRCSLPPWREPAAIAIVDRDVRPDAGTPGVLRVTASFRNDARWPQPWPRLSLTLSDVDGHRVGMRDFSPREYLGATPAADGLAPGQAASIAIDVLEPDARSVAFDFVLH